MRVISKNGGSGSSRSQLKRILNGLFGPISVIPWTTKTHRQLDDDFWSPIILSSYDRELVVAWCCDLGCEPPFLATRTMNILSNSYFVFLRFSQRFSAPVTLTPTYGLARIGADREHYDTTFCSDRRILRIKRSMKRLSCNILTVRCHSMPYKPPVHRPSL